jgi:hypothetical protein
LRYSGGGRGERMGERNGEAMVNTSTTISRSDKEGVFASLAKPGSRFRYHAHSILLPKIINNI